MPVTTWQVELFGEFTCLNFQCCPEIEEWLQQTFFFPPTRNGSAHVEKGGKLLDKNTKVVHTEPLSFEKEESREDSVETQ